MKSMKFYLDGNSNPMKITSDKFFELCPHCECEVELKTIFDYHKCPNCGKEIKPCSLCKAEDCGKCRLDNTF